MSIEVFGQLFRELKQSWCMNASFVVSPIARVKDGTPANLSTGKRAIIRQTNPKLRAKTHLFHKTLFKFKLFHNKSKLYVYASVVRDDKFSTLKEFCSAILVEPRFSFFFSQISGSLIHTDVPHQLL